MVTPESVNYFRGLLFITDFFKINEPDIMYAGLIILFKT